MANLNPNQRIYDVMGEIHRGSYRIPNIQRGYEWGKARIAKLLDSIMNGYPIGAIMVWKPTPEVQADISDRSFIADFRSDQDYLSDSAHPSDAEAYLVLDGQQRLQSLYLSFYGSYDGARVYMAIDHLPSPQADDDDYEFEFLTRDEARQMPQMIPLAEIVKLDADTKSEFAENLAQKLAAGVSDPADRQRVESDKRKKITRNIDRFIERFNVHPVLLLQEVSSRQTYDHVLEIFERVNSGVTVSDCEFRAVSLAAIYGLSASDFRILNNTILGDRTGVGSGTNLNVGVWTVSNNGIAAGTNQIVRGNRVRNTYSEGILARGWRMAIADNTVEYANK